MAAATGNGSRSVATVEASVTAMVTRKCYHVLEWYYLLAVAMTEASVTVADVLCFLVTTAPGDSISL